MARRTKKQEILRRLNKAREGLFPHKTCPASRHVHLIVEGLLDNKDGYGADLRNLGYEPDHLAGSIASVLENLWQARRWMRWQPNIEGDYMKGGEWVPDMEALDARGMSAGTAKTAKPVEGASPPARSRKGRALKAASNG